jgi:hypothetical protein
VFRCKDMQNYWVLRVGADSGMSQVIAFTNGSGSGKEVRPLPKRAANNKWCEIVVQVLGTQVKCWVGGEMIFDGNGSDLSPAGYVMLATQKTATRFRNLKVTDLRRLPRVPVKDPRRLLVGGIHDLELSGDAAPAGKDGLEGGAKWKGHYQQFTGAILLYREAVTIEIKERKGTRFKGELAYSPLKNPEQIRGNVDAKGNVTCWADGFFYDKLLLGTIKGGELRLRAVVSEKSTVITLQALLDN